MIVRHTDGLGHVNLETMDMDEFKAWLWPGVMARLWTCAVVDEEVKHAWPCAYDYGRGVDERYWFNKLWHEARVYAGNIDEAKRKAMAMVKDYLDKRARPCAMTKEGF